MNKKILILICIPMFVACSTSHKFYEGDELPKDKLAILYNKDSGANAKTITIDKIDDVDIRDKVGFMSHLAGGLLGNNGYEVKPGKRRLVININLRNVDTLVNPNHVLPKTCDKVFNLKAGHEYYVDGFWRATTHEIFLWDKTTQRILPCIKFPPSE